MGLFARLTFSLLPWLPASQCTPCSLTSPVSILYSLTSVPCTSQINSLHPNFCLIKILIMNSFACEMLSFIQMDFLYTSSYGAIVIGKVALYPLPTSAPTSSDLSVLRSPQAIPYSYLAPNILCCFQTPMISSTSEITSHLLLQPHA